MGRLADPSKEGFYNVAISMEGLLKEQKTRQKRLAGCGKSGADAPSKAAAESQAAVHVSRVAEEVSGAAAAAAAEPGLKWYATSSGRMVALQPVRACWCFLVEQNRVRLGWKLNACLSRSHWSSTSQKYVPLPGLA